jgi:regulator of replication initiation timing
MYKSMQAGLDGKIQTQDAEITDLRTKLAASQQENADLIQASERMKREKDGTIEDQHVKMTYMSKKLRLTRR